MDNLFQILIFLFVIYTILNSVFGKKKPQGPRNNFPQGDSGEVESDTSPQTRNKSGDILQDLFGVQLPKSGDEYDNYSQKKYDTDLETDLPNIEDQSEVEKKSIPDINYDNLPAVELQQNKIVQDDLNKAYEVGFGFTTRTIEIKQKIRNPKSLQELYLISEIINKPKSLRK